MLSSSVRHAWGGGVKSRICLALAAVIAAAFVSDDHVTDEAEARTQIAPQQALALRSRSRPDERTATCAGPVH
jgi:hypothetical protein